MDRLLQLSLRLPGIWTQTVQLSGTLLTRTIEPELMNIYTVWPLVCPFLPVHWPGWYGLHTLVFVCIDPTPLRARITDYIDGRRPIYMASMPCLCIGSLGVARATSVPALMSWRVVQAFGASGGMSLGPAVIGDIYKLEERGSVSLFLSVFFRWTDFHRTAMGLFLGVR